MKLKKSEHDSFPVGTYRSATRDERYWKELAEMTPEEKVLWVEKTKDMICALREAVKKCRKSTL